MTATKGRAEDFSLRRALVALDEGRFAEALGDAEQAIAAAERTQGPSPDDLGTRTRRAASRRVLAAVWVALGRADQALELAEEAARIARGARDAGEAARAGLVAAEAAYAKGDALIAHRYATRARILASRAGDADALQHAVSDDSVYLWSIGDGARAGEFTQRALAMKVPQGGTPTSRRVLLNAARLDHAAGRFDSALDRLDEFEGHTGRIAGPSSFSPAALRAFIYVDIGALDVARALMGRRPLQEPLAGGTPQWMKGELFRLRASIALAAGERPEAVERLVGEALALPELLPPLRAELERLRAQALLMRGHEGEAERIAIALANTGARSGRHAFASQAFAVAARAGHPDAWLLRWLGSLGLAAGGIATRVEFEGLSAISQEPDPIGVFARTMLASARTRLVEHTPEPLRVTMKRTLRQIEARTSQQRTGKRTAPESALDRGVLDAKEDLGLAGSSEVLLRAVGTLARAAKSDASLVITGETGSGKELFARLAHRLSERSAGPFVAINCAAIPHALLEAELFGHERGAFTGAERGRPGLFVEAEGGTLLLDEVGEMSPAMQSKLLRVLEDRMVRPIGGTRSRKVNVRVIAATHRDLSALVSSGAFREDLFYRLAAITVRVPSLRERPEDIPTIARAVLARDSATRAHRLDVPALTALAEHDWPGNVRELVNALRVAAALVEGKVIGRNQLEQAVRKEASRSFPAARGLPETTLSALRTRHRAEVRELVGRAIASADGNKLRAARALGVSRQGLYRVLER